MFILGRQTLIVWRPMGKKAPGVFKKGRITPGRQSRKGYWSGENGHQEMKLNMQLEQGFSSHVKEFGLEPEVI